MSYPEFISFSNGKYCCSVCNYSTKNKYYITNGHLETDTHLQNVKNDEKVRGKAGFGSSKPAAPKDDSKTSEETLKRCLEDNKKMKELIDNQKKEITMLRNKIDEMVQDTIQKIRIYNEESNKIDKMVTERKNKMLNELFGIV